MGKKSDTPPLCRKDTIDIMNSGSLKREKAGFIARLSSLRLRLRDPVVGQVDVLGDGALKIDLSYFSRLPSSNERTFVFGLAFLAILRSMRDLASTPLFMSPLTHTSARICWSP